MEADNRLVTSITIPSNAGPGQPRIVIQGNTITGYYADNLIGWQCTVTPVASVISEADVIGGPLAALYNGTVISTFNGDLTNGNSCSIWQSTDIAGTFIIGGTDNLGNYFESKIHSTAVAGVVSYTALYPSFEIKHSVTPGTGWSNSAGTLRNAPPVQYWYNSLDQLEIRGALSISNIGSLSSTAFVLDAPHTPKAAWNLQQDYIFQQSSAGAQKGPAHIFISGSNVSINNLSAVAVGDIVNFNHTFAMGYNP